MKGFKTGKVSRTEKLNSEFQKEISVVLSRKLKNPLATEMVSVVKVDVSPDLAHAKVFLSVFSTNEEKKKTTFDAIKSDAKKIRYELSQVMRLRTIPELHFSLDDSMEYGDKMDKLFKSINQGEKRD